MNHIEQKVDLTVPVHDSTFYGTINDVKHPGVYYLVRSGHTTEAGGEIPTKHRRFKTVNEFVSFMQVPHSKNEKH